MALGHTQQKILAHLMTSPSSASADSIAKALNLGYVAVKDAIRRLSKEGRVVMVRKEGNTRRWALPTPIP